MTVLGLAGLVGANLVGYRSTIVRSGSMGDAIPVGSLVLTEPVPRERIAVGDVAVVDPEGPTAPRLHRVTGVFRDGDELLVATRGDANPVPDSGLTTLSPQVEVPALTVPYLGYLVGLTDSRAGVLALATGAAAVAGWWALRALWRPTRRGALTDAVTS